jgi:hypothetical protein
MHASGAIVTKLIPFLGIPVAMALSSVPTWVAWTLLALGIMQVITDVVLSTKSSDWAKFRREMDFVR